MESKSFVSVLKIAVVAGLVAGTVAGLFHLLLTEPVIDRAIEMEERLSHTHRASGEDSPRGEVSPKAEPVVSRRTQRVGLVIGFILYGGAWGLLFAILYYLIIRPWFLSWSDKKCGFALAMILGWSVAIFPFLKYPANPPGVGESETVAYRQGLYIGLIGLSLLGAFLTLRLQSFLVRKKLAMFIAPTVYAVYLVAVYLAMPSSPDPIRMPTEVVWKFRTLSLIGLVLFWSVMGGIFAWKGGDLYGSNNKSCK